MKTERGDALPTGLSQGMTIPWPAEEEKREREKEMDGLLFVYFHLGTVIPSARHAYEHGRGTKCVLQRP